VRANELLRCAALCLGALTTAACTGVRAHVEPPPAEVRAPQTAAWLAEVERVGADGDWLVVRGYHPSDDLVVTATNMPLSHAAVLDLGAREVIEAIGSGVQLRELGAFLHDVHRVIVVRPKWWSAERGRAAAAEARTHVGAGYDFLGTVGLGSRSRFYCSELAVHVYRAWHGEEEHLPRVIEPGQMLLWGRVLYDSGPRD
jgi:hypothetical protein